MSSLFQDGGCCGGNTSPAATTNCKGCVCSVLQQLINQSEANICQIGTPQKVLIKQKGTSMPVSLDGSGTPTVFTLQKFDPTNCCAVFTFEDTSVSPSVMRTFIEDCRSIAGIVCMNNTISM